MKNAMGDFKAIQSTTRFIGSGTPVGGLRWFPGGLSSQLEGKLVWTFSQLNLPSWTHQIHSQTSNDFVMKPSTVLKGPNIGFKWFELDRNWDRTLSLLWSLSHISFPAWKASAALMTGVRSLHGASADKAHTVPNGFHYRRRPPAFGWQGSCFPCKKAEKVQKFIN